MKVLLKEDVENLGLAGEVYDVKPGYGRNYLVPQGMAVIATANTMKQAEAWRKKAEARREEMRAEYAALSERIEAQTLTFTAKAGETGKLYGSITSNQIADELNATLGTDIDRRKVSSEPLRQLGDHEVSVRLNADFQPTFKVVVESEDGVGEEETIVEQVEEIAAEIVEEVEEAVEEVVETVEEAVDEITE